MSKTSHNYPFEQSMKLATDAVVFGYTKETGLSVLLIKRKIDPFAHQWAIPGGFVHNNESLEDGVVRELREETGLTVNYLEQLYTFGNPDRDPRYRVVSVAYYALVKPDSFITSAGSDAEDVSWFPIDQLPSLAFDHSAIIASAIQRLRGKITYEPIGFELLEEKFPFSDLEHLYINLLGREIDRRNFKRKIKQLDLLIELDETAPMSSAGRPGKLYSFNKEKYFSLKERGFLFDMSF
ncbi:Bifunctional NMN adenylyltransferase/Nudix hydrolase [compost metagenome]